VPIAVSNVVLPFAVSALTPALNGNESVDATGPFEGDEPPPPQATSNIEPRKAARNFIKSVLDLSIYESDVDNVI
jgi:hypothetical protein